MHVVIVVMVIMVAARVARIDIAADDTRLREAMSNPPAGIGSVCPVAPRLAGRRFGTNRRAENRGRKRPSKRSQYPPP